MIAVNIVFGLAAGYCLAITRFRQFMTIAYHAPYRFWRSYNDLYDAAESRHIYELLGGAKRFKSYQAFLVEYRRVQPYAQSYFKHLWDTFAWRIGFAYALILLASLAAFWNDYLAFVLPFLLVQSAYFAYIHFHKQYRLDFFAVLMINNILLES